MKTKCCGSEFNEQSGFWAALRAEAASIFTLSLINSCKPEPEPLFERRTTFPGNKPSISQQIDAMCKEAGREADMKDLIDMQHGGFASNAKALVAVTLFRPAQLYRLMR